MLELRTRLLKIFAVFFIGFMVGSSIGHTLIEQIIQDLGTGAEFVALSPLELIYTQLKVGLFFAIFVTLPVFLYHAIMFIKPGATGKEMRMLRYALPYSLVLFAIGAAVGYKVLLRVALMYLAGMSSLTSVQNMWSIHQFVSFVLMACIAVGLLFELPLVLLILRNLGLVDHKMLSEQRPYLYVAFFALAAVVTPPDIATMLLLAIPFIGLYEISLLILRLT